jgi:hypothetical protein
MEKAKIDFIGWQEGYGHTPGFPLFNLQTESMFYPTTVSKETLEKRGYEVPKHPTLEEWVEINKRAGKYA